MAHGIHAQKHLYTSTTVSGKNQCCNDIHWFLNPPLLRFMGVLELSTVLTAADPANPNQGGCGAGRVDHLEYQLLLPAAPVGQLKHPTDHRGNAGQAA